MFLVSQGASEKNLTKTSTMTRTEIVGLLKSAADCWSENNAPRLGAALAYYTLLSIAPLAILVVLICNLVIHQSEPKILEQVRMLAGANAEQTVHTLIQNANQPKSGLFPSAVAAITLLLGASGVFSELRDSLNTIWSAPKRTSSTLRSIVWQRVISIGMVLALGFLLLVSLILSAAIGIVENFFTGLLPLHLAVVGEIFNFLVPLVITTVLFALIFKFVPDVPIDWREVIVGAAATAVFFTIGKALLGLYLGTIGVSSAFGAAGSLVAFVVWVYYSAQIFFFGAVFTRVYADSYGVKSTRRIREKVRTEQPSLTARSQTA
jgi:membrane protein